MFSYKFLFEICRPLSFWRTKLKFVLFFRRTKLKQIRKYTHTKQQKDGGITKSFTGRAFGTDGRSSIVCVRTRRVRQNNLM